MPYRDSVCPRKATIFQGSRELVSANQTQDLIALREQLTGQEETFHTPVEGLNLSQAQRELQSAASVPQS